MLWTKKKKVIVFFGSIGAILLLTASIATPLVLINSKKDKKNSRARDKDQIDKQNVIDKQIVDDVVKLFNPLVKATNGTPTTIATKTITLPSALKLKTKAEDIGFIDPSLNKRNGAIVKFKVKSIDNKYGTLEVEVLIDKGITFETLAFKLKDYQTSAQALANAKSVAKAFINGLTYPKQDDAKHNASLFGNIDRAKQAALKAIDNAKTPQAATAMASSNTQGIELIKVKATIDDYNNSAGTNAIANKALAAAKTKAKAFINGLTYPLQDDRVHDANKFGLISIVKQAALKAIDEATTPATIEAMVSSPTAGTELVKVKTAIDAYNNSTGTTKILNDAKVKATNDKITAEVQNKTGTVVKKTQVNNGATPTNDNLEITAPKGFTYTFKSATAVNEQGKSTVTVDVNVDPAVANVSAQPATFEVSGFETKEQADKRVKDAEVKAANDKIVTEVKKHTGTVVKKTQVNNGATPTNDNLEITVPKGFTYTFKSATAVNEQGKSTVTVDVNVDPAVANVRAQPATFEVSGFETKEQADKRVKDAEVKAANDKITAEVKKHTGTVVKKTQVNNGATPTNDNLEITAPKGFTYTFKSATAVNDQGKSTVTVDVNVDPAVANVSAQPATFEVFGFETKEQADKRVKDAEVKATNDKITAEVQNKTGTVVKKTQVNNGATPTNDNLEITAPKGFTYTFKSATAVNEQGKSTVTVDVNVDPAVANVSAQLAIFEVSGFETKADADQKIVDDIAKLFDPLVDSTAGTPTNLLAKATTLPASLNSKKAAQDIGFIDPSLNKRNGTTITFKVTSSNNSKGTLDVEVKIKKGKIYKTLTFKLKDYQTTAQAKDAFDKKLIDDEKARIEGLERGTITKNVFFGRKNILNLADLRIGKWDNRIKYIWNHPKILKDGDYDVVLKLTRGSQEITVKRKIHIIGIDATTMKILNDEQTRVNNFIYSKTYLERDRFNSKDLEFVDKMELLGLKTKLGFWYQLELDQNGIKIEVSMRNSSGQPIYTSTSGAQIIKITWLNQDTLNISAQYDPSNGGTSFTKLNPKMKTKSQENILDTFKKYPNIYGLPQHSEFKLYKITVSKITKKTVTYVAWITDEKNYYDLKTFDVKFN